MSIFTTEHSYIPYLNVFPAVKDGKRITPQPLLQEQFSLYEKMSKKFELVRLHGQGHIIQDALYYMPRTHCKGIDMSFAVQASRQGKWIEFTCRVFSPV